MAKAILITGATGKQGGAVITSLLSSPLFSPETFKIYAVTRSPTSPSATRLAAKSPAISLIQGDFSDVPSIFASLPSKPWGVFSVQLPGKAEVAQGKAMIDEAFKAGAEKFVFTSVERGGDKKSDSDPTIVPHFKTKFEIEQHLIAATKTAGGKASYTILRPVFFLDNLEWGFIGKLVNTAWRDRVGQKKLQVIDTKDIGAFGAAALLEPESEVYRNQAISIAGDELSFEEANAIFQQKTGKPIPTTYSFMSSLMLWAISDMGHMFSWFVTDGFGADVSKLRAMDAGQGLKNFGDWVDSSSFGKAK
ncbi:hypothetical protein MMC25_004082 [Agyrium rufum]|nr:hypothetical protein [Agyrium rufum]